MNKTVSPAVVRMCKEEGIDPQDVEGTGKKGGVCKVDVIRHMAKVADVKPEQDDADAVLLQTEAKAVDLSDDAVESQWEMRASAEEHALNLKREALEAEAKAQETRNRGPKIDPAPMDTKLWKPNNLDFKGDIPGYRCRWCDKKNQNRYLREGYILVTDDMVSLGGQATRQEGRGLTSTIEYGSMVLMALPVKIADARKRYHTAKAANQTTDPTALAVAAGATKKPGHFGGQSRSHRGQQTPHRESRTIGNFLPSGSDVT